MTFEFLGLKCSIHVTKKIDETITTSVEQYSGKNCNLICLEVNLFKKFNKRGGGGGGVMITCFNCSF